MTPPLPDAREQVETLRAGLDPGAADVSTQQIYERWLKHDAWRARAEALPLLIGVEPGRWNEFLHERRLDAAEQQLWAVFSATCEDMAEATAITPARLRAWATAHGIVAPICLERLADFISQVVPSALHDDRALPIPLPSASMAGDDIVLGAALSLVAKMPEQCRDERGFYDGARIAHLIEQKAALWFDDTRTVPAAGIMAKLIDPWLD